MNKIYRVIWSDAHQTWVAAAETTSSKGKPASSRKRLQAAISIALMASSTLGYAEPPANTLPTGGNVVAGQAGISQSGATLNINQTTAKAAVNWNTFSIGSNATVNIVQPNQSSVLLNRVIGSDPSQIYGRLNANGQVFLINPNGVLFGKGARVDVGGLVATTLNIKDSDFLSGNYRFSGNGGSVVNQGELYGNYIALLAPEVRNEGVIVARQGTVALAGSTGITLNLVNNQLIDVMVDAADINTLVENKHLIQAEEGTVIMAAQSANHLLGKLVNSGRIEAQGISTDGGKVRLTASSNIEHSGSINVDAGANGKGGSAIVIANLDNANSRTDVSGTISAKGGSVSGDGGFVETSANTLKIADSARINTTAAHGKRGTWLLDPNDFIVGAAGDITGAALGSALDISNVTIQTTVGAASCTGAACGTGTGGNGDIIFNEAVYWITDGNVLTLDAYRNIVFNQSVVRDTGMFGMPGTAIEMTYGTSGTGAAYTTPTADWMAPFSDPFAPANMFIQDNTAGGALTPAVILGAHTGSPLDLYLGAKNIPIFVNAVSGTSTYDGNAVPFLPTFSLDAPGVSAIDIIPTLTAGMPTFNTPDPTHAGTYAGVLYTGGLTSAAYDSLAAGNAAATWTIDPATLTVTLTNTAGQKTKTYDGTNAAPVGFTPTYGFVGLVGSDTATLSNTGATYTGTVHAGAANSNTLTVAGLSLTGISGGSGLLGDYTLSGVTSVAASATINPIQLTAALTNVGTTKVYDGGTNAPGGFVPTYSFTGSFLAGDTAATLNNTGAAYTNAHVAFAGNNITVSGLSITGITGGNGSLATDYVLTNPGATASAAASITPIMLTATLNNVGTHKVYDGTTAAPTGFTPTYNGIVTGVNTLGTDAVNLTGTFTYNDKDVLDAASIGTTNLAIGSITGSGVGSQATDYQLTSATTSAAASIIPANLTLTGSRTVDGTTIAAGSTLIANGVNGEKFSVTGSGDSSNLLSGEVAGSPHTLNSLTNLALGTGTNGEDANNYNALSTTGSQYTINAVQTAVNTNDQLSTTVAQVTKMTWKEARRSVDYSIYQMRYLSSFTMVPVLGRDTSDYVDRQARGALHYSGDYATAKTVELLLRNGWTAKDFKDQGIPLEALYTADGNDEKTFDEDKATTLSSSKYGSNIRYESTTEYSQKVKPPFTRQQLIDAGYSETDVDAYLSKPKTEIKGGMEHYSYEYDNS